MLVCSIYRPPESSVQFFEDLTNMIESAFTECMDVLLLGDLNVNDLSASFDCMKMKSLCKELL